MLYLLFNVEQGSQSSMRDNDLSHAAKEKILTLEEENNMLKYKIELLLDMVCNKKVQSKMPILGIFQVKINF